MMRKKRNQALGLWVLLVLWWGVGLPLQAQESDLLTRDQDGDFRLTKAGAAHLSGLALRCIGREFPNKPGHVPTGLADVQRPKMLHPAFYGCFDWHSSVHGHWMLVRLLKAFPDLPKADQIRAAINQNLTSENIAEEVAYFQRATAKSFERTYGWAWLLKLAEELHGWDDPDGQRWAESLAPLAEVIAGKYLDFLPRFTYPNRTGEHPNTAFGLAFAWDYAVATGHEPLKALIAKRSMDYYAADRNCPASWEPGGSDFLSPCLEEADLMRRIMPAKDYARWLRKFLPARERNALMQPAEVSDRSDPKIVHLDGLNLSRAWCFRGIARSVSQPKLRQQFRQAANDHLEATVVHIASGSYEGEHWLASFAVYALLG